jgi:hypothetical protein
MTMLEKAISKTALARIDVYRRSKGIRSRKQALEKMLEEVQLEHPLTTKLREASANSINEAAPESVQKIILEWREGKAETTSHAEMRQILERRKRDRSH